MQGEEFIPGLAVPETGGAVLTRSDDAHSVWEESRAMDFARMPDEFVVLSGSCLP